MITRKIKRINAGRDASYQFENTTRIPEGMKLISNFHS